MTASLSSMQLGKAGVTENFLSTLRSHFQTHRNVKITVLRSACRDKQELKTIVARILETLGTEYTARAVGYTINVKKWRKAQR